MPLDLHELTELLLEIRAEQCKQAVDLAVIKGQLETALDKKGMGGLLGGLGGLMGAAAAAWAAYKGAN